jgi:hypothetical protein
VIKTLSSPNSQQVLDKDYKFQLNPNHNNLTDNDNTINNGSKDQTVVDDLTNTPNVKNISKGSSISNTES